MGPVPTHQASCHRFCSGFGRLPLCSDSRCLSGTLCHVRSSHCSVWTTVTSHVALCPECHGTKVRPSGLFPSSLLRPSGSLDNVVTGRMYMRLGDVGCITTFQQGATVSLGVTFEVDICGYFSPVALDDPIQISNCLTSIAYNRRTSILSGAPLLMRDQDHHLTQGHTCCFSPRTKLYFDPSVVLPTGGSSY